MKRVLLLGDSISMGYRDRVRELLSGKAEVCFNEGNGCFAKWTLWQVNAWIRENGAPDIVHWNNGIWDMMIEPPLEGNFSSVSEYLFQLGRILQVLQTAGVEKKNILFATTTPPRPEKQGLDAQTVAYYNGHVKLMMQREGIAINDLYALVFPHVAEYVCDDFLHLSPAGYEACAQQVARAIEALL